MPCCVCVIYNNFMILDGVIDQEFKIFCFMHFSSPFISQPLKKCYLIFIAIFVYFLQKIFRVRFFLMHIKLLNSFGLINFTIGYLNIYIQGCLIPEFSYQKKLIFLHLLKLYNVFFMRVRQYFVLKRFYAFVFLFRQNLK